MLHLLNSNGILRFQKRKEGRGQGQGRRKGQGQAQGTVRQVTAGVFAALDYVDTAAGSVIHGSTDGAVFETIRLGRSALTFRPGGSHNSDTPMSRTVGVRPADDKMERVLTMMRLTIPGVRPREARASSEPGRCRVRLAMRCNTAGG